MNQDNNTRNHQKEALATQNPNQVDDYNDTDEYEDTEEREDDAGFGFKQYKHNEDSIENIREKSGDALMQIKQLSKANQNRSNPPLLEIAMAKS